MKKLFITLAAIAALTLTGCKAQWGVIYSVNANGDADGKVAVTFPNGALNADGKAGLDFVFSNDTTKALKGASYMTLQQGLLSGDKKTREAASNVNGWVDETFRATSASGTYFVHFKGYVRETATGLTFSIDRTFTNR